MSVDKKGRIYEIDALRGLALILMCLDHLMYDLYALPYWFPDKSHLPFVQALHQFGEAVSLSDWRLVLHYIFASLFLLMAGVGSALTRHPLKRCGQITLGALAISGATILLDHFLNLGVTILFGVLSVMALGTFLCFLTSKLGGKYVALALGIVIVAIGFYLPWYGAQPLYSFEIEDLWGVMCGTLRYGADWFPIFPCAGVVLIGYFLGKVLYADRRSRIPFLRGKTGLLCKIGQKPLWIYLLHQPVLAGLLFLMVLLFARG